MGCGHSPKLLHHLTISLIFLLIPFTTHFRSSAKGRMLVKPATSSQVEVEKTFLRGQIGSRPPRCERRCGSCGHCEAIQVPTTPQSKAAINGVKDPTVGATNAYSRGDYSSNYKPMSWKCKCGSFIFDP
ncbi:EPIDERMAL PATTERNING FACTOR-like protein 2 [Bidens hawaiensis]|uniref:EPIDERMAL PATTERNING FACTOR-like protein 2 n=1 Tax=Bidens hawaiensis TaxID=980011 RepID=UPI00404A02D4